MSQQELSAFLKENNIPNTINGNDIVVNCMDSEMSGRLQKPNVLAVLNAVGFLFFGGITYQKGGRAIKERFMTITKATTHDNQTNPTKPTFHSGAE